MILPTMMVEIAASRDRVFAFMTNPKHVKQWQPDVVESIPLTTRGVQRGTRWRVTVEAMLRGQPGAVHLDEACPVLANDVGHLEGWPRHRGCNLRERFTVSGVDTVRVSKGLGTAVTCRCDRGR